jgi:hypothetical protein
MKISRWLAGGQQNARVLSAHAIRKSMTIRTMTMTNVATRPQKAGTR